MTYLPLAGTQGIPLSLHELSRVGNLNVLEVTTALALIVELEEGIGWSLDLPVILYCAKAVARSSDLLAVCHFTSKGGASGVGQAYLLRSVLFNPITVSGFICSLVLVCSVIVLL